MTGARGGRGVAALLSVLLIAACAPATSSASSPSGALPVIASPAASNPAATAPTGQAKVTCSSALPATPRLALVQLAGTGSAASPFQSTLAEVADPARPKALCAVEGAIAKFVSADTLGLSRRDAAELTLIRYSVSKGKEEERVTITDGQAEAWSSDGAIAYIEGKFFPYSPCDNVSKARLHLRAGGKDRVLVEFGPCAGRDVGEHDGVYVRFSASGRYVALVNSFSASTKERAPAAPESIRVFDQTGASRFVGAGSDAVWVRDQLYFLDASGVRRWDAAAGVTNVLPGTEWFSPAVSLDGTAIVYVTRSFQPAQGTALLTLYLYRIAGGQATSLVPSRSAPAFLTPTVLVASEDVPCAACSRVGHQPTGKLFLYDLATKQETPAPYAGVADVWPRP